MKVRLMIFLLTVFFAAACNNNNDSPARDSESSVVEDHIPPPVLISYQLLNQFPHDTLSFTEGLTFYNGQLYESTGAPDDPATNHTWVGPVDLKTGSFEKKIDLGKKYFGEGITFLNDKMYQLTWKSQTGFVYDARTFKKIKNFSFKSEGWGLTNDGTNLIMSTGSSNLYFLDPDSMAFVKMLPVQDNNGYVSNLNELEFVNGSIYANHWLTSEILKIDPASGHVVAKLDLGSIVKEIKTKYPNAEEMNGIAYDSSSKKTYITGKKWPFIYQIAW